MNAPSGMSSAPNASSRRETVASLRSVGRFFDNSQLVHALTNVSFEVDRGEIFGLLGPKDSGKSTTLKLLAGQLSPSEGKVKVFGRSPRWPSVKARVGYLAEPLDDGSAKECGRLRRFLRELFSWFPRSSGKTTVKPVSAAQRSIALSQLLLKSPELVLLDEPFSGQDSERCREMKELIHALALRGKTVVLSSDSLGETKDVCSRMAVYYAGRIQAIGTLNELLAQPDALRFTAPLIAPRTTERLLGVLREELSRDHIPIETAPRLRSSPEATDADKALAPLLKAAELEPPRPLPASSKDAVNHEKLAELTRPAPGAPPLQPKK